MNTYTAVLVDDMPSALTLLKDDLARNHPEITVIGTANSVVSAAKLLRQQAPDMVFLDIMLGDGTSFDLLEILPTISSKVIFVTASDEYAIRAFKFAAIDYVLKPYAKEELATAVAKGKEAIRPNKEQYSVLQQSISSSAKQPKKISLHTLDKVLVVALEDIIRCQSDNNYTLFYFKDGTHLMVTKTLKHYADLLESFGFLRVHQSHLVNLRYIKEYRKTDGGYLILKDKSTVPVSVRKRTEVLESLQNI